MVIIPFQAVDKKVRIMLTAPKANQVWALPRAVVSEPAIADEWVRKMAVQRAGVTGKIVAWPRHDIVLVEVKVVLHAWPDVVVSDRQWVDLDDALRLIDDPALLCDMHGSTEHLTKARPFRANAPVEG